MELKVKIMFVKDYLDMLIKEKYIKEEDVNETINTVEDLQDFLDSVNLNMWSYAVADYAEIKYIGDVVLVINNRLITDKVTEYSRFFELVPTIPSF